MVFINYIESILQEYCPKSPFKYSLYNSQVPIPRAQKRILISPIQTLGII
jgi:hypothetical protein